LVQTYENILVFKFELGTHTRSRLCKKSNMLQEIALYMYRTYHKTSFLHINQAIFWNRK